MCGAEVFDDVGSEDVGIRRVGGVFQSLIVQTIMTSIIDRAICSYEYGRPSRYSLTTFTLRSVCDERRDGE